MKRYSDSITREQLIADFKLVIHDAEALLKATANKGDAKLDEIRARAEQSLNGIKDGLGEAESALIDQTRDAVHSADAYVHQNPWNAIGIAAGVGVLVGLLTSRN